MNEELIIKAVTRKSGELVTWVKKVAKDGELSTNIKMHYISMLDGYTDLLTASGLIEDIENFREVLRIVWNARQEIERTLNNWEVKK